MRVTSLLGTLWHYCPETSEGPNPDVLQSTEWNTMAHEEGNYHCIGCHKRFRRTNFLQRLETLDHYKINHEGLVI